MSEKALFDENLTAEHGLAHVIRTRLLGVDPDEWDVHLDDADWQNILDMMDACQNILPVLDYSVEVPDALKPRVEAIRRVVAVTQPRLEDRNLASERFANWLNQGPALAAAAGCYVGIKVTEASPIQSTNTTKGR